MKKYIILSILLSTLAFVSCVKDLDVTPEDPSRVLSGNIADNPAYVQGVLAKIYASFNMAGQGANGGADITAGDENFFTALRALWNLQEITTDEAICAWGDVGIADLNTQTWTPSNPFLTALYQRLSLSVTYANDFLILTEGNSSPEVVQYRAEARFLRALAYFYLMDMFGNPPFTTEADGVGKYFPTQLDPVPSVGRAKLYDYIVAELKDIEDDLADPGTSYPQATKAAAWMLLAKVYLNAGVYTGTPDWANCVTYCDRVISSNAYDLADNYRQNFSADNDGYNNPEMIFAWAVDGVNAQGYVGTTFIIESSSDATYVRAEDYHGLTSNTNWNGNRARKDFMNILVDTLATYNGGNVDVNDTIFAQCPDKRVYLRQKANLDIPTPGSSGDYGIGVYKFTAKNANGSQAANYDPAFASTDFPVFRLADAYLMRAEAHFRLGNNAEAVADINVIRERAFGNTNGNISTAELSAQFILDERAREFYYEAQRRTDLIRFGQFTDGTYHWQWKGNSFDGVSTQSHLDIFPIPGDEISANPNIKQNDGYN